MIIILNGKETEVANDLTIKALLDSKGIAIDAVVVELNKDIIPAGRFEEVTLNGGDYIEVLRFVGGG